MKTIFFAFALLFVNLLQAQDTAIREGSELEYNIFVNGGSVKGTLFLQTLKEDTIVMDWAIRNVATNRQSQGRRWMSRASIQQSTGGFWNPPFDGENIEVPADQAVLLVSVNSFNELMKSGRTKFDGQTITINKSEGVRIYKAGTKNYNAWKAVSENGKMHMWILANASFPLILKLEGNPFNVDVELVGVSGEW